MIKKILLAILIATCSILTLNAEGFKNIESKYFYKTTFEYSVEDWSPAASDNFYIGISYDGITYERITDTTEWGTNRPIVKKFKYTPQVITDNVKFGIFINPNDIWSELPTQEVTVNFVKSSGTFSDVPDVIYNNGTYNLKCNFNANELPKTITLQYTEDDGLTWTNINVLNVSNTIEYKFLNSFLTKNAKFRYVYNQTNEVVAETNVITVEYRNTYFKFKTIGGQKELNDVATIIWEKTPNFEVVYLSVYLNDELKFKEEYLTDNLLLNFNEPGAWKVVGLVESPGFRIEQMLIFTVGDPCSDIKEQNKVLKDSVDYLSKEILELKEIKILLENNINKKDSIISELELTIKEKNELIDKLNKYIEDSTNILNLVYQDGQIVSVKDIKYEKYVYSTTLENNYIDFNDQFNDNITYWIFDMTGKLVKSEFYEICPNELYVGYLSKGAYYFYFLYKDKYSVYKFIR